MRIGLNATCLNNRPSGARQRFVGIYSHAFRLLQEHEFVVFEPADCRIRDWFTGVPNVSYRATALPSTGRIRRFTRGATFWSRELKSQGLDALECFHLPALCNPGGNCLLTIHDVGPLREKGSGLQRSLYSYVLRNSVATADRVITVSHCIREEIEALFPDVPVSVLYNGIDLSMQRGLDIAAAGAVTRGLGLPQQYLLTVGHFSKRKNHIALLEALPRLRNRGLDPFLVMIGNDSGELASIRTRISELGLADRVRILTGLSDHEVRCIYRMCELFVFPSHYEGFGIPVLEAMAAGRPMAISDIPVFSEITQGQGAYFDPGQVDSMVDVLERVLGSDAEQHRLVRYGEKRVSDFGFELLAVDLGSIYRDCHADG
jgi:glycosyltransferase involved in cell wall biosynthesis